MIGPAEPARGRRSRWTVLARRGTLIALILVTAAGGSRRGEAQSADPRGEHAAPAPTEPGVPGATRATPSFEAASDDTFGIAVTDYDDPIARLVGIGGGLRVLGIRAGSLGSRLRYEPTRRPLGRGDFVFRVWVKNADPEQLTPDGTLKSKDAFIDACKRAKRMIAERPEKKGEIVFDVWTLAGYNMEDYRMLSLSAVLEVTGPSPSSSERPDSATPAPGASGSGQAGPSRR